MCSELLFCRAYDSSRDFPTATERRVYGVLMMRDPVRIRDVLKALLSPADTSSVLQQQQQLPPNAGPAQARCSSGLTVPAGCCTRLRWVLAPFPLGLQPCTNVWDAL